MPICVILRINKNDVGWIKTIGRESSLTEDVKTD
jgi:hypothetical protein